MVSFLHKMDTCRIDHTDMKRLVRILRNVPERTDDQAWYRSYTKQIITGLPRRLRSSPLSFGSPQNLCYIHKGLNVHLINDIWEWLKYEFEGALGAFMYPMIMHNLLTPDQQWKVRQLEPVLQMWQRGFSPDSSAPPGHAPIFAGDKWYYQRDQCPACMMARIGSDKNVLFALFSGMVCRFNIKETGYEEAIHGFAGWNRTSSKRVRFIKYWLRKTPNGDNAVFEAGELGMRMKRLRRHCDDLVDTSAVSSPANVAFRQSKDPSTTSDVDAKQAYEWYLSTLDTPPLHQDSELRFVTQPDPKIGPNPRPSNAEPLTPAESLGFERLRINHDRTPQSPQDICPNRRPRNEQPPRKPPDRSHGSNYSAHLGGNPSPSDNRNLASLTNPSPHRIPRKPVPISKDSNTTTTRESTPKPPTNKIRKLNPTSSPHIRKDSVQNPLPLHQHTTKPLAHLPSHHPPRNVPSSIYSRAPTTTAAADTKTILSYTGGPSARSNSNYRDPFENPIYNYIESQEERTERYRQLLAQDDAVRSEKNAREKNERGDRRGENTSGRGRKLEKRLPKPQRSSIYSAYGDNRFDWTRFDGVDVELAVEEREELEREARESGEGERITQWDDLY